MWYKLEIVLLFFVNDIRKFKRINENLLKLIKEFRGIVKYKSNNF